MIMIKYSQGAHNPVGVGLVLIASEYPGHPEIGDFRVHLLVQQYVTRFQISMDNPQPRVSVEVEQSSSDPFDDVESLPPVQLNPHILICIPQSIQFSRRSVEGETHRKRERKRKISEYCPMP